MSVPNIKTIEKIAERHNVSVLQGQESGRRVIELYGNSKDIKEVIEQIGEGYSALWKGDPLGAAPRVEEPDAVAYLYSGRVNWAELGY
jgi:hypothetical protein